MLKPLTVWITTKWKILKEMGIPAHLICILWNLDVCQEATVRTEHGKMDWFQIGKWVCQGCILSLCLFNLYTEYIMRNARLDEAQAGTRLPGEISITSDMQRHHPYGRKWRGTKEPLDESEREEQKLWLKTQHTKIKYHGIWSHYFMTNRWRKNGYSKRLSFPGLQKHCRW